MDDRIEIVRRLLMDYVRSPSLKHIWDGYAVSRFAAEIVRKLDRGSSAWRKWSGPRQELVKAAAPCVAPIAAWTEHLNAMMGPPIARLMRSVLRPGVVRAGGLYVIARPRRGAP